MDPWSATLGGFTASALCGWAMFHPRAQVFGPTVRRLRDRGTLGLTFDDGPDPGVTPRVLHLLDRFAATATFFVIGQRVERERQLVAEIAARGHLIANHTATHRNLAVLSAAAIVDELSRCQDAVECATGRRPALMRPPWGGRGPYLASAIRRAGLSAVVTWSRMAGDWEVQPAPRVIRRLGRAGERDIVLLHDADHRRARADRTHTLAALEFWLPRWRDAGLRCVTLDTERGGSP